jgi:hypothetical protein
MIAEWIRRQGLSGRERRQRVGLSDFGAGLIVVLDVGRRGKGAKRWPDSSLGACRTYRKAVKELSPGACRIYREAGTGLSPG